MRRLLWLGVGLAVGGLVVRAASRKAKQLSPTGIAGSLRQSAVGVAGSVRSFVADVRDGMAEREAEIQAAFTEGALLGEDTDSDEGNR
jgi:hypothetical protein